MDLLSLLLLDHRKAPSSPCVPTFTVFALDERQAPFWSRFAD